MDSAKLVEELLTNAIGQAQLDMGVPFQNRLLCFMKELQKLCETYGLTIEYDDEGAIVIVNAYNQTQAVEIFKASET
jgi:hypothetical protein